MRQMRDSRAAEGCKYFAIVSSPYPVHVGCLYYYLCLLYCLGYSPRMTLSTFPGPGPAFDVFRSQLRTILFFLRSPVRVPGVFLCAVLVLLAAGSTGLLEKPAHAARSASILKQNLENEKKKAAERKKSLQTLTAQERKLNADLAAAEKSIIELENRIARHQNKLLELDSTDDKTRKEYEELLAEHRKTEAAQAQAMRLLWDITSKRIAVGSRDMADWAEADREYAWSKELLNELEGYRKTLEEREAQLLALLGKRNRLAGEMQKRIASVNAEKNELLKSRLAYDRKLAEVRRERVGPEAELHSILSPVENLNPQLSKLPPEAISTTTGRRAWPVKGKLLLPSAPPARPTRTGRGCSPADTAAVRAVAAGKVVHNDVLRGFGTVLIVQHNADYFSLYAYLGSSPLKVGQEIKDNQKIGTVGFYPAIEGPGLYFELRFKQKAINPEQWFAS